MGNNVKGGCVMPPKVRNKVARNPETRQNTNYMSRQEAVQRRSAAIEMRRAGADVEQIALRLGYASTTNCERDLTRALTNILRMPKEEAKALELMRIDGMLISFWPDARKGVPAAADRVMKLIELRAKLLGLFAPVQVEQVSLDAIESEIMRLEKELGTAARRTVRKARKADDDAEGTQSAPGGES